MLVDKERVARALPNYSVGEVLGSGGLGLVFAGRHRHLGRDVAIKVLVVGSDGGALARFRTEARVLARLDHPHIARTYDYGEHGELAVLVVELLTGGVLSSLGRGMSAEGACAVALAAAEALSSAHAGGVLHGDVKPGNVLFTAAGQPKVTDFGVARIYEASMSTATTIAIGTPTYTAPEQLAGDEMSPASDLYALGAVLYELLAGVPPFGSSRSVPSLIGQKLSATAPPPPAGVPGPLAAVLLRVLAREPSDRHPSAHAFALDLAAAGLDAYGPDWLSRSQVAVVLPDDVREATGRAPSTVAATERATPRSGTVRRGSGPPAGRLGVPTRGTRGPLPSRARAGTVFISYAREDEKVAGRLADVLRLDHGIDVWWDREIRVGERWSSGVERELRAADVVLVLITKSGLSSWMLREVEVAIAHSRQSEALVIPVFVDDSQLGGYAPYGLQSRQGVRLDSSSRASFLDVAREVSRAIETRQLQPPADAAPRAGRMEGDELRDVTAVVLEAFAAAGRGLRVTEQPQLLGPEQVWVSREVAPTAAELERFGDHLSPSRIGYFVHLGELQRDAEIALDQMRVGGKPVITLSVRALRAALADGRAGFFLTELEQGYGTKDNLFDTKNALIDERFLFGRDVMLNTIGSAIRRGEHVLVTGLRKVGKTSLLNVLRQHLVDQPVCVVDLQRFDRQTEEWPLTLFRLVLAAVDRWGLAERQEWPFSPTEPASATELEEALGRRRQYLGGPAATPPVVVVLDELERVFPGPFEPDATRRWITASGALRALAQSDHRQIAVVGADLRPVANRENTLGATGTNPFFSLFQEMPVPLLDRDAVADMVESLARAMGIDAVTVTFVDRIFELTGGHPSLARSVAAEAYRQRKHPHRLTDADLEAGLDRLDDTNAIGFFLRNNLWQLMTPTERAVVADLARRHRVRLRRRKGSSTERREAHATLRAQGLVDQERLRIGLFEQWVREHDGGD